jgi:hypothetical protein
MVIVLFLAFGALIVVFSPWPIIWLGLHSHPELLACCLVVGFFLIAVGLYALRAGFRFVYGLLEIVFGLLISAGAVNSLSVALQREYVPIFGGGVYHRPPEGWLHWSAPWVAWLQIAAAIYILVRGLDNVGEGLNDLPDPRWRERWCRLFPTRRSRPMGQKGVCNSTGTLAADATPSQATSSPTGEEGEGPGGETLATTRRA